MFCLASYMYFVNACQFRVFLWYFLHVQQYPLNNFLGLYFEVSPSKSRYTFLSAYTPQTEIWTLYGESVRHQFYNYFQTSIFLPNLLIHIIAKQSPFDVAPIAHKNLRIEEKAAMLHDHYISKHIDFCQLNHWSVLMSVSYNCVSSIWFVSWDVHHTI